MSDAPPVLKFSVADVHAVPAAVPTLAFMLSVEAPEVAAIAGLGLNVQVRIAAERRRYGAEESERLFELFGPVGEWSRSLGAVPWTKAAVNVPGFSGGTLVDLQVPCTYDFEVAAAKYLTALEDGEVPIELLFSGTLLYTREDGRLQTAMIPWDREASVRMPVSVWREAVDSAFPDSAWLRIQRDVFGRLQGYRSRHGLTTWEATLEALLEDREG